MKKIGATLFAVTAIFAGACGDDSSSDGNDNDADADNNDNDADADDNDDIVIPDADGGDDIDAPIDGPTLPAGCDYAELNNTANDPFNGTGLPELTQLSYTGGADTLTVCGTINNGQFYENEQLGGVIDVDAFQISLAQQSEILVSMTGQATLADIAGTQFAVIPAAQGVDTSVGGFFIIDRALGSATLPAGDWLVIAAALADADATVTGTYKVQIKAETLPGNCAAAAGAPAFTEANDGPTSTGNDVYTTTYGPAGPIPAATAATDTAEPTGLTLAPLASVKWQGNSAAVNVITTDEFFDGDAFAFSTDGTTNQGRFRLNWTSLPAADADLDFWVAEIPAAGEPIVVGYAGSLDPEEFAFAGLKPNTNYIAWVGGYDDDIAAYPVTYTLQVCGETFTAP